MEDLQSFLARYLGVDKVNIVHKSGTWLSITAIITGEAENNFYALFKAFLREYEKANGDFQAQKIFANSIKKIDKDFRAFKKRVSKNIKNIFTKHGKDIRIVFEGDFKEVYIKIQDILKQYP